MSATKTKVQSIIDENPVAVFSKSYCPYCNATKKLLSESGAKFYSIELDQVGTYSPTLQIVYQSEVVDLYDQVLTMTPTDDGSAIQSTLGDLTGQTTVPNIFINKQHIGGNSDLQAKKGDLKNLLREAGAV
jgi:glutaredoxin 3